MALVRGWNADVYHRVSGPQVAMAEAVLDRLELRGDETAVSYTHLTLPTTPYV